MKRSKLILGLMLAPALLAACAPVSAATATATAPRAPSPSSPSTAEATTIPKADVTATTPSKEAPAPTMDGNDCLGAGGSIERFDLDSEYLDAGLQFRVYTPPCYMEQAQRRFPVLYMIHGQTYNDDQWVRLGIDEAADALITSGELAPFIIVMPYDISSAQPSVDPFNEAFLLELLPWVEANYRTIEARASRAVGGLSRGASWALHFGLLYPDVFGAMAGHSPPVFVEEAGKVRGWLDAIPSELMPRIWLDIGDRDRPEIYNSAAWFAGVLDEKDIPHEWHLNPGAHDEAYWSSHMETYLRWYAAEW